MVVCPLCEHPQAGGTECEVCGRRLPAGPEGGAPVPTLPELEPTQVASAPDLPIDEMMGLEVTAHAPVDVPASAIIPELEPSAAAPVDVSPPPLPDIERSLEGLPSDAPTPYPAVVICRYCRTEAQLGEKLCGRCGMRLPTLALVPPPQPGASEVQLCTCGTPLRGSLCPHCGARAPTS